MAGAKTAFEQDFDTLTPAEPSPPVLPEPEEKEPFGVPPAQLEAPRGMADALNYEPTQADTDRVWAKFDAENEWEKGREAKWVAWREANQSADTATAIDVLRFTAATDLDPEFIQQNLEEVRKTLTEDQLAEALAKSPRLTRYMSDAAKAPLVKSAVADLNLLEWLLTGRWEMQSVRAGNGMIITRPVRTVATVWEQAFADGLAEREYLARTAKEYAGAGTEENRARIEELRTRINADYGQRNLLTKGLVGAARNLPELVAEALVVAGGAKAGAVGGTFVAGPPGTVAGTATGAMSAEFAFNFMDNVGMIYDELVRAGIPPEAARQHATGSSLAVAGVTTPLGLLAVKKMVPGVGTLIDKMARKGTAEAFTELTKRQIGKKAAKGYLTGYLSGNTAMAAQAGINAMTIEMARAANEGRERHMVAVGLDAFKDGFIQAAEEMWLLSGWGPMVQLNADVGMKAQIEAEHARLVAAEEQSSKVELGADPVLVAEKENLVGALSQPGKPEALRTVYVAREGWDSTLTEAGFDPAKVAAELLGDGGKGYAASEAGGYVEVPIQKWLAKFSKTELAGKLRQDVKTSALTRTPREQALREAVLADMEANAKEGDPRVLELDGIYEATYQQLLNAGRTPFTAHYTATVVRNALSYLSATMTAEAKKEGKPEVRPSDVLKTHRLRWLDDSGKPTLTTPPPRKDARPVAIPRPPAQRTLSDAAPVAEPAAAPVQPAQVGAETPELDKAAPAEGEQAAGAPETAPQTPAEAPEKRSRPRTLPDVRAAELASLEAKAEALGRTVIEAASIEKIIAGDGEEAVRLGRAGHLVAGLVKAKAEAQTDAAVARAEQALSTREALLQPLTKAYNKKAMDQFAALRRGVGAWGTHDLNHLTQINTRMGHEGGNLAIKATVDTIRAVTEKHGGQTFHWGGDELASWLPSAEAVAAWQADLDAAFAALPEVQEPGGQRRHKLSISTGIGLTVEAADAELYRAKEQAARAGRGGSPEKILLGLRALRDDLATGELTPEKVQATQAEIAKLEERLQIIRDAEGRPPDMSRHAWTVGSAEGAVTASQTQRLDPFALPESARALLSEVEWRRSPAGQVETLLRTGEPVGHAALDALVDAEKERQFDTGKVKLPAAVRDQIAAVDAEVRKLIAERVGEAEAEQARQAAAEQGGTAEEVEARQEKFAQERKEAVAERHADPLARPSEVRAEPVAFIPDEEGGATFAAPFTGEPVPEGGAIRTVQLPSWLTAEQYGEARWAWDWTWAALEGATAAPEPVQKLVHHFVQQAAAETDPALVDGALLEAFRVARIVNNPTRGGKLGEHVREVARKWAAEDEATRTEQPFGDREFKWIREYGGVDVEWQSRGKYQNKKKRNVTRDWLVKWKGELDEARVGYSERPPAWISPPTTAEALAGAKDPRNERLLELERTKARLTAEARAEAKRTMKLKVRLDRAEVAELVGADVDTIFKRWVADGGISVRAAAEALGAEPRDLLARLAARWVENTGRRPLRATLSQPGYHGGPFPNIKSFRFRYIGKGEGAQAYGWGIYFAQRISVAQEYHRKLSENRIFVGSIGLADLPGSTQDAVNLYLGQKRPGRTPEQAWAAAAEGLRGQIIIRKLDLDQLEQQIEAWKETPPKPQRVYPRTPEEQILEAEQRTVRLGSWITSLERSLQFLDTHKPSDIEEQRGALYRAEIPEPEELLKYDLTLESQPEIVEKLRAAGIQAGRSQAEIIAGYEGVLAKLNAEWDTATDERKAELEEEIDLADRWKADAEQGLETDNDVYVDGEQIGSLRTVTGEDLYAALVRAEMRRKRAILEAVAEKMNVGTFTIARKLDEGLSGSELADEMIDFFESQRDPETGEGGLTPEDRALLEPLLKLRDDQAASTRLREAGIPGLMYRDGLTRRHQTSAVATVDGRAWTKADYDALSSVEQFAFQQLSGSASAMANIGRPLDPERILADALRFNRDKPPAVKDAINALAPKLSWTAKAPDYTHNFVIWDEGRMPVVEENGGAAAPPDELSYDSPEQRATALDGYQRGLHRQALVHYKGDAAKAHEAIYGEGRDDFPWADAAARARDNRRSLVRVGTLAQPGRTSDQLGFRFEAKGEEPPKPLAHVRGSGPNGELTVMSLFDGIGGAQIALDNLGARTLYFRSEIDKYANTIQAARHPENMELGDVRDVDYGLVRRTVDLLVGGSPCEDLSQVRVLGAGGRQGLAGAKSGLFSEFVRALRELGPRHFVFENVASMTDAVRDTISRELGVEPIMLDGALVTGAKRPRYFWTNIPTTQLVDLGIQFKDVLDKQPAEELYLSETGQAYIDRPSGTPPRTPFQRHGMKVSDPKARTIVSNLSKGVPYNVVEEADGRRRALSPEEVERLLGVPEGYTGAAPKTGRFKTLGDGFAVPVVEHILAGIAAVPDPAAAPRALPPAATPLTEGRYFKEWFAGSKVVDKKGQPIVVFHATIADRDFDAFRETSDVGFHFTSNPEAANTRIRHALGLPDDAPFDPAMTAEVDGEAGPRIQPYYLSIQKPLRMQDHYLWEPKNVLAELVSLKVISRADEQRFLADPTFVLDRETFASLLEAKGYDGVVYDNSVEGGGDSYIALRPQQIKSAVGNAGTFSPRAAATLAQAARRIAKDGKGTPKNLVVMHNLTADNLLFAEGIGGIPVPSIAVSKKEHPLFDFGEIALLAEPDLIDPAKGVPVFAADAYTSRFPQIARKLNQKALDSLDRRLTAASLEVRGGHVPADISELLQRHGETWLMRAGEATRAVALWLWMGETGFKRPTLKTRDRRTNLVDFFRSKAFQRFAAANDLDANVNFPADGDFHRALSDAAVDAAMEIADEIVIEGGGDEDDARAVKRHWLVNAGVGRDDTEAFLDGGAKPMISFSRATRFIEQFRSWRKQPTEPDAEANVEAIFKAPITDEDFKRFEAWGKEQAKPVLGEKRIAYETKGGYRRTMPFTLDNLVWAMTKDGVRGGEHGGVSMFGLGAARAMGVKQYRTLSGIQRDRNLIVPQHEFQQAKGQLDRQFEALADELSEFSDADGFGLMSELAAVVGDFYKRGAIPSIVLESHGFKNVPDDLLRRFRVFAEELRGLPTEYFEAKPTRAVRLEEFKAAVVPETARPEAVELLKKKGLKVYTYKRGGGIVDSQAFRAEAIAKAAEENGLLWQPDRARIKFQFTGEGDTSGIDMDVTFLEGADESSALHEIGHWFSLVLQSLAARPGAPRDLVADAEILLKHMGYASLDDRRRSLDRIADLGARAHLSPQEQAELDTITAKEEQASWGLEAYFGEGKSPNLEMAGIFARYRLWMLKLWNGLDGLRAEFQRIYGRDLQLSPEVRALFERVFVADAEGQRASEILLSDAFKKAMPNGDDLEEWKKARAKEREAAEKGLIEKIQRAQRRETEKWWKEEKAELYERLGAAIDAEPPYRALGYFQRGWLPQVALQDAGLIGPDGKHLRVDRAVAVALIGKEAADELPRGVLVAKNGTDPDYLAGKLNFPNGRALLEALRGLNPREQELASRVQAELEAKYGPALLENPAELGAVAIDAAQTDAKAERILLELRWLARQAKAGLDARWRAVSLDDLKATAERLVGQLLTGDVHPDVYLGRERAAARRALDLAAKGKLNEAFDQKEIQLLNQFLWRAARNAKEERDRALAYVRSYRDDKVRRRIGKADPSGVMLQVIDDLLASFNFSNVPGAQFQTGRRARLEKWIEEKIVLGYEPTVTDVVLDAMDTDLTPETMTIDQLRALRDAIVSVSAQARAAAKVLADGKLEDKKQALAELEGQLRESFELEGGEYDPNSPAAKKRTERIIYKLKAAALSPEELIRELDGGNVTGPWHRYVLHPIQDARAAWNDLVHEVSKPILEELTKLSHEDRVRLKTKMIDVHGKKITMEAALAVALNWGTDSNRSKLLRGAAMYERHGLPNLTDADFEAILRHLTGKDWDLVERIWRQLDSMWPAMEQLERRLTGLPPPKVPPRTFEVEVDGAMRTIQGGYYPMVYDPRFSKAGAAREEATQLRQVALFDPSYARAATPQGHLQKRLDRFARPVLLALDPLPRAILEHAKDITGREAFLSVHRILTDEGLRAVMEQSIGEPGKKVLDGWLRDQANHLVIPDGGASFLLNLINKGKQGFVGAVFAANVAMAIQNLGGYANALNVVKAEFMWQGIEKLAKDRKAAVEEIKKLSGTMRYRERHFDRDIRQNLEELTGKRGKIARAKEVMLWGFMATDAAVSYPVWWGAYQQAQAPKEKGGEGLSQKAAVRYADRAVRLALSSADNLPAFMRDPRLQWASMFATWSTAQLNQLFGAHADARRLARDGLYWLAARRISRTWFTFIAGAILADLLVGRGPSDDDKDDEVSKEEWAKWIARRSLFAPALTVPFIGSIARGADSGRDVSFSPWVRAYDTAADAGSAAWTLGRKALSEDEEVEARDVHRALVRTLEAGGYLTGMPVAQGSSTIRYWLDEESGDDSTPEKVWGTIFGPKREGRLSRVMFGE